MVFMRRRHAAGVFVSLALTSTARAQEIEPRSYSNAPVGVNFAVAGVVYTRGGLEFPAASSITDAKLDTYSGVLAYARAFDFMGKSAKFDVIVPYMSLSGTALFAGQPVERSVDGFVDPRFRLSVNFFGAPALQWPDFRNYRQDLIVGASLQVSPPWGQYDRTRLVNIGANRWTFKPELGVSKVLGSWTLEGKLAATVFTANDDFFGGARREQAPIYSMQGNVIYSFGNGVWASFDGTYYTGGRTSLNGVRGVDLQQNTRAGATLALPVDARNSVKLYASSGVHARTNNNFDLLGIAWQHRWGGGL
jgi:outer membrane putative beta-barrel porin/alpha-amylase